MVTTQERKNVVFTEAFTNMIGRIQNRTYDINLEALDILVADLRDLEIMFSEEEVWNTIREYQSAGEWSTR
jgi:hypothetical protein